MSYVIRTQSGKRIFSTSSKRYSGLFFPTPLPGQHNTTPDQQVAADLYNAIVIRQTFAGYTQADHVEIARWHEDGNDHRHAGAHYAAAGYHRTMCKYELDNLLGPQEYLAAAKR